MDITNYMSSRNPTSYPHFTPLKIETLMKELGFPITVDEINNPADHRDKLKTLYKFFLDICAGNTDPEATSIKLLEAAASTDYPELHQDFSSMNFYTATRDLMAVAGYNEFAMRDLYNPTSPRLISQLSALLNLALYREEKLVVYQEHMNTRLPAIAALKEVGEAHHDLQKRLERATSEYGKQQPELQQLVKERLEMEAKIKECNGKQARARLEAEEFSAIAEKNEDELEASRWELQELSYKKEKLRAEVVSSPDRRKSELVFRRERLNTAQKQLELLEQRVQQVSINSKTFQHAVNSLNSTCSKLSHLKDIVSGQHDSRAKLEDGVKEVLFLDEAISTLEKNIAIAERTLRRAQMSKENSANQHALNENAIAELFESTSKQLVQAETERRGQSARLGAALDANQRSEQAIADSIEAQSGEMEKLCAIEEESVQMYVRSLQERHAQLEEC